MTYTHGEEPVFTEPEPTPDHTGEKYSLWTPENPEGPFVSTMVPKITIMGGKSVDSIILDDIVLSFAEPIETELGKITLTPDGSGNTIVSIPDGLGTTATDRTLDVEYEGTKFLKVIVKPKPSINFNLSF
ncbi:hypothetical protein [Bacillus cihuensis]|uniref:hypothetical protein n=1 Tax=Bacillus cihuensis TaxID=1208599 RepID=UPI00041F98F2|nr:hypothetical protein [Bacillus cihuensis]